MFINRRDYDTFIETVCPAGHLIKYQGDLLKPVDKQAFAALMALHAHCRPPEKWEPVSPPQKALGGG